MAGNGNSGNLTRWKKGQSGNPAGTSAVVQKARTLFGEYSPECATFLVGVVRDKGAEMKDRINAAKYIVDMSVPRPAPERDKDADAAALEAFARALAGVPTDTVEDDDDG